MRIGFTGSQGTGKTSVAKAIIKQYPNYTFVSSSARAAAAAGYKVNRDANPLSQLLTTSARIADEDVCVRFNPNTVSDRTPLDSLAYTMYQNDHFWKMPENDFYMDTSAKLVMGHMVKYDAVYYFPVIWEPRVDEVRDGDVQYQRDIDWYIKMLLGKYGVKYTTMPAGTVQERVDFISGRKIV